MVASVRRVVVVNDASFAKGGATGLAIASALELHGRGLEVTFITGDDGESLRAAAPGIEVVSLGQERMGSQAAVHSLLSGLYNRPAEAMLAAWIAKNDRPDVVYHLHGWAQIFSPSIFRALTAVQDRLVISAHDFFLACPNGAYAFLKSGKLCNLTPMSAACVVSDCDRRNYGHKAWRLIRHAIRQSVFDFGRRHPPVLAIHEAMRPILARAGIAPASIIVATNPIRPFLSERCTAETNRGFLFVGRLESGKGPDLAAQAARLAGAPLTIVGDGPMRAELERTYPEVTFTGRLSGDEVGRIAASMRALLMPSRYPEPFGLVAAEALWSGLPVILSDTAFLAQDIVQHQVGLACDTSDADAFAAALRTLADDDALVAAMSRRAFAGVGRIGQPMAAWIDQLLGVYAGRLQEPAAA